MSTPNEQTLIPVTILGSRWLRGGNSPDGRSFLLHPESRQLCCLGFCALAIGHTEAEMEWGETQPYRLARYGKRTNEAFYDVDRTDPIALINDDPFLYEVNRIEQLEPRLRELGFSPTFDLDH